jgi:magnesium-transporting ATPase (P-type)
MSETVLNAAGTSAAGTVTPMGPRTFNLKYFGWLYIFLGFCIIIFGYLTIEYPKAYDNNFTATSNFNWTNFGVIAVLGLLILIVGYLDYRGVKSMSSKIYFPAIIFILGIALIPLFTDYGAFNGILASNNYDLSGISMGGFLLVFASLGEIYLMRTKKPPGM